MDSTRLWLVATIDKVSHRFKKVRPLFFPAPGGFAAWVSHEWEGLTETDPMAVLFWTEGPTKADSVRMMKEELKRPKWDWLRSVLEPPP